jgi:hypothetical protein
MHRLITQLTHSNTQLYFCGIVCVAAIVGYLYFLNISVMHVVLRKESNQEVQSLKSEIAQLETRYIEAQHAISNRIATLDGYSVDTAKIFVTRGETSLVLRDN